MISASNPWEGFSLDPRARRNGAMRASDADRDHAADLLGDAYAEGRLQPDEYEERLELAMQAHHLRDLPPLLLDLGLPSGSTQLQPFSPTTAPALSSRTQGISLALSAISATFILFVIAGWLGWVGLAFTVAMAPRILELLRGDGPRSTGPGGTNQLPRPDKNA